MRGSRRAADAPDVADWQELLTRSRALLANAWSTWEDVPDNNAAIAAAAGRIERSLS
jgi:hypothetical protein